MLSVLQADILLRGYGGYNTRVALRIAGEVLPLNSPQPAELVTLWFGEGAVQTAVKRHMVML